MKTYTEEELKFALELQKAECYQVVGNILLKDRGATADALNYLSDPGTISIKEVDAMLKGMDK